MKSLIVNLAFVLLVAAASSPLWAETTPPAPPAPPVAVAYTNAPEPKIQFTTAVYDFGKVLAGATVKYDFAFTNAGDGPLEISGVSTSCGCTTAGNWTRAVEPGKTGVIPVQFNSGNYNGPVSKTVTVTCNDKSQPTVVLQIKGTVWKPFEVNPKVAVLNAVANSSSNAPVVLHFLNNQEQPIIISDPESDNPTFAAELKTIQPGKEFELVVRAVPPLSPGNVVGRITLKTSSPDVPVINISAMAVVRPAVVVSPQQITLPPEPITVPRTYTVSIQNNGATPLTLSEPVVTALGVGVQMKEIEPGRRFALTLTFSAGFETAPGQNVELNVKSSNPQFQVIRVPIQQQSRPVPATARRGPSPPVPINRAAPPPWPAGAQ